MIDAIIQLLRNDSDLTAEAVSKIFNISKLEANQQMILALRNMNDGSLLDQACELLRDRGYISITILTARFKITGAGAQKLLQDVKRSDKDARYNSYGALYLPGREPKQIVTRRKNEKWKDITRR